MVPSPARATTTGQLLSAFLAENNVKVISLFREWDEDGNGALDKKELRKACAALGYYASREDLDELFRECDHSGDGLIDINEMKHALNCYLKGQAPSPRSERVAPSTKRAPRRSRGPAQGEFDWGEFEALFPDGHDREAMEARRRLWA